MAKKDDDKLIVGLDIGTSKVLAIVGEIGDTGEVQVIGVGHHPSRGMKKGVVVNIESTVQSIQRAVEEAELMAGVQIRSVYAGIAGSHIQSFNSHGIVAIKDKEVGPGDVERVIEAARALAIPADQKILHVLPQEFIIDKQEVREPVGMSGVRLEAKVHIVTGAMAAAENVVKCVRRCGLEVENLVLHPLASSHAVLTDDEKELGVVVVDIGAGTTDVAVFTGGAIRHTAIIPVAGDLITNDIAMALRTPTKDAEEIKLAAGVAKQLLASPDEQVEVPGLGDRAPRMLAKQALAGVIEPRVEEIFMLVQQAVKESGCEELISSGVVLTGGSAQMPGMVELAEDIFFKPARIGVPHYAARLADMVKNPRSSTAMGLLIDAQQQRARGARIAQQAGPTGTLLGRVKDWFTGNF